ncbi:MAG: hypothetical protein BJ554DRAFT_7112 [Olpidium bornovanus]|uniref:Secreted protein n=1 Tax=Olpidium bornovanus TaxID=278681 RepID=A0A8H7ZWZ1_9FUNG|nr:MAG: hypothetical protein BJ554DRAFT_7112 [Olpidium bornovanus]
MIVLFSFSFMIFSRCLTSLERAASRSARVNRPSRKSTKSGAHVYRVRHVPPLLIKFRADLDDLGNVVTRGEVQRPDVDLEEVVEVIHGKALDLLRPGSAPHERLSVRPDLVDNLPDLGLEAHVKHAVRLVENQVRDSTEVGLAGFQHVNQTAGSGDADFDTWQKQTKEKDTSTDRERGRRREIERKKD